MAAAAPGPGPGMRPVIVNGELRYVRADGLPASTSFAGHGAAADGSRRRRAGPPDGAPVGPSGLARPPASAVWLARWRPWLIAGGVACYLCLIAACGPRYGLLLLIATCTAALLGWGLDGTGAAAASGGRLSAYSVFNQGYASLPGQLKTEHFEAEIRGGVGGVARAGVAAAAAGAGAGGGGAFGAAGDGRVLGGGGGGGGGGRGRLGGGAADGGSHGGDGAGGNDDDVGDGREAEAEVEEVEERDLAEALERSRNEQ